MKVVVEYAGIETATRADDGVDGEGQKRRRRFSSRTRSFGRGRTQKKIAGAGIHDLCPSRAGTASQTLYRLSSMS